MESNYDKLVEALRILQAKNSLSYYKRQVCKDAADAIEALQAEVERLQVDIEAAYALMESNNV